MPTIVFLTSSIELRAWFKKNHATAQELWIGFYKKKLMRKGITYPEALDEALCFGWIDGIRKSVDDISYTNRFTPRKQKSNWSEVNIKRVGELIKLRRMKTSGLEAFAKRDENKSQQYSYEQRHRPLDTEYEKKLKANKTAWEFFRLQTPSYRKTSSFWVMSAKQEETRLKRLTALIKDSENGQKIALLRHTNKGHL